ncbi:MAG TPA: hypothetical protein EYO83_01260 [Gemmatimonadetes bacterium]|nr:hypothetical protein [Gemmatimonadota bacterium]
MTKGDQLVHPVPELLSFERILAEDHGFDDAFDVSFLAAEHVALGTVVRRDLRDRLGRLVLFTPAPVAPLRGVRPCRGPEADHFDIGDLHIFPITHV